MAQNIIQIIQPVSYYILFAFLVTILFLPKAKKINKLLVLFTAVSFATEAITVICILFNVNFVQVYNLYIFFIINVWIAIFYELFRNKHIKYVMAIFNLFAVINLIFIEKSNPNFYTFIVGSFLLIGYTILNVWQNLQKENLRLFDLKTVILIFSPQLFFLGFSFMFAFRSNPLFSYLITPKISLYNFISSFVNFVFFSLIIYYTYLEKKSASCKN